MALSKDIREKVVKAIKGGMSLRQAAARFDVGPATDVRWAKRVEDARAYRERMLRVNLLSSSPPASHLTPYQ